MKFFLFLSFFTFFIFSCDGNKTETVDAETGDETAEESDDENDDSDQVEEIETHELIGMYKDSFDGPHIISNTVWDQGGMMGRFNIEFFDSEQLYIIAQNSSNNAWNPDKWSRFDYFIKEGKKYFCQTAYDLETMEDAKETAPAENGNLESGCNGFNWTELLEIIEEGVDKDDSKITHWATGYESYIAGEDVDESWQTPEKALGKAKGTSTDVVSLGRGGSIVLTFEKSIKNGDGPDFAVFENSFNDTNLELGYVEVSSDGKNFVRFDTYYLGVEPVGPYGSHEPSLIWGFAGKFKQGVGTLFDLEKLSEKPEVVEKTVDLNDIKYVKIVDVIGDGTEFDTLGNPIYDPYPTTESAGFDLDGVGVIN